MKIRKDDNVRVIAGKDRGKEGVVTRVLPGEQKVIVEGVNMVRKHQRATRTTMQGGIIDRSMPLHVSNVMLLCNTCGAVRVGFRIGDDGEKVRVCKSCGAEL